MGQAVAALARPAAAPSLQHRLACPSPLRFVLGRMLHLPAAHPGEPPPLTEPVSLSLFSHSSLPLSLRTHALRLPGLVTAPQGGCPGFTGSAGPGPDPSCSFPFSLGSQSLLCDFPVARDLRICSSTPSAPHYPSPTSFPLCKSLVDVAKVFREWRHPGCRCLRFCGREGSTVCGYLPSSGSVLVWTMGSAGPGPRTKD